MVTGVIQSGESGFTVGARPLMKPEPDKNLLVLSVPLKKARKNTRVLFLDTPNSPVSTTASTLALPTPKNAASSTITLIEIWLVAGVVTALSAVLSSVLNQKTPVVLLTVMSCMKGTTTPAFALKFALAALAPRTNTASFAALTLI